MVYYNASLQLYIFRLESSIQFVHVMSYMDLDNDGFIDLWNFILVTTKESSTVLFKLKHVAHYLVKYILDSYPFNDLVEL